jgi:hypothetical protein
MTRLVLHAGMPKTGTTAFQTFAWHNRDKLADRGVAYCDGFRGRSHSELAVAFSHRVTPLTRSYGVHDEQSRAELLRRLPSMLGDPARAPTVLASSEHLVNLVYRPATIAAAADTLRSLFDEVLVVLVVRRSDYWTPSMYTESIKSGGPRPFDADFVKRHRRLLDHAKLFSRWREAFGDDNVVAVPFLESDKAEPTILPSRLLATAGVDLRDLDLAEGAPQMENMSLSAYGVELLRRLNSEHADTPAEEPELALPGDPAGPPAVAGAVPAGDTGRCGEARRTGPGAHRRRRRQPGPERRRPLGPVDLPAGRRHDDAPGGRGRGPADARRAAPSS